MTTPPLYTPTLVTYSDIGSPQVGSIGGSNSNEVSLNLIFFKEIQLYNKSHLGIPTFDGGIITEVLGKGQYKVNLQFLGRVVTAKSGEPEWSTSSTYLKGAYALILVQNNAKDFVILSVRQQGVFAPKPTPKYSV